MKLRITSLLAATLFAAVAPNVAAAENKTGAPAAQPVGAAANPGVGGAAAVVPPPGPAAAPPKPQAWQKFCDGDIQKLCKGVTPGMVPECLAKNEKDLSESCTSAFLWRYQIAQICKDDIGKFCKEKLAAHTTTLSQCFKENEASLSAACKAALLKGSKQQKAEDKSGAAKGDPKLGDKAAADKGAEKSSGKPAHPPTKKH